MSVLRLWAYQLCARHWPEKGGGLGEEDAEPAPAQEVRRREVLQARK